MWILYSLRLLFSLVKGWEAIRECKGTVKKGKRYRREVKMPGSEKEYKYWGRLARNFHRDNLYVFGVKVNQVIRGWLVEQFNEGDIVLELGCGTGFYSEMVIGRVKQLTATDLAPEMIEQAKRNLAQFTNVEVRIEDCYNTSFKDNVLDGVACPHKLYHFLS